MKQPLRQAILLLGLSGCAGCSTVRAFKPPLEPVEHFSATAETALAETASYEELPTPAIQRQGSNAEEVDPVLKEPLSESWPSGSIANEYAAEHETVDELPASFYVQCQANCSDMLHCIGRDYRNYYSCESLGMLTVGVGLAAIVANTDLDVKLHTWYQDDIRSHSTDEWAHVEKYFGEGGYEAALMATTWMIGNSFGDTPWGPTVAEWGGRGMRAIIVGAPPMLLMQYVTGASRPLENSAESSWKPFNDANGVSGHAFMGALPFITAAKMTDAIAPKLCLYTLSTFPAWSRVNDDAHYTSQIFLGWWMAYWACTAVDWTELDGHDWHVMPLPMENGAGMAITYQY